MNPDQQKVLDYLKDKDTSILTFSPIPVFKLKEYANVSDKELENTLDLNELVYKVVRRTYVSDSLLNGNLDTLHAKNRSSLDIWRHVKLYKPEVTIFQVMQSLMNNLDKLICLWCHNINRRVFLDHVSHPSYPAGLQESRNSEYDLHVDEWRTIAE